MDEIIKTRDEFVHALLVSNNKGVATLFKRASSKWSPMEIADGLLAPSLEIIGRGWEEGIYSLSQVYMSGRICENLVETVMPPKLPPKTQKLRIAIAVIEDYHSLGKNMVRTVLKSVGYDVADYGHGLSVTDIVKRVLEEKTDVLMISALMLPSALLVHHLTKLAAIEKIPVKVVVGGAPFLFDDALWREVGADVMGRNASDAIGIIKRLSGELP